MWERGVGMTPACTQNLRLKALLGLVNFNLKTGDSRSIKMRTKEIQLKALSWYSTRFHRAFFLKPER